MVDGTKQCVNTLQMPATDHEVSLTSHMMCANLLIQKCKSYEIRITNTNTYLGGKLRITYSHGYNIVCILGSFFPKICFAADLISYATGQN